MLNDDDMGICNEIVSRVVGEQHSDMTSGTVRHRRCVGHDDHGDACDDALFA